MTNANHDEISRGREHRLSLVRTVEPVLVELRYSRRLAEMAAEGRRDVDVGVLPRLDGVEWDGSFALIPLRSPHRRPGPHAAVDLEPRWAIDPAMEASAFIARAWTEPAARKGLAEAANRDGAVAAVSADLPISFSSLERRTAATGQLDTVRHLLGTDVLAANGFNGAGVFVAVIDAGINRPFLERGAARIQFDEAISWSAGEKTRPYTFPVGHGTMCAFDVAVAAPVCTVLDVAAFRPYQPHPNDDAGPLDVMLSDAIRAFGHLCELMVTNAKQGRLRSLVVSCSWEVDIAHDHPPDSSSNYGSNPDHALNKLVGQLALLGADIVFSAGNTSSDERENAPRPISGANSHPSVLTVGAVDVESQRLPISRPGPGVFFSEKPDVAAFARFAGSAIMGGSVPDDGTSAACALAAGVIAAVRSGFPYDPRRPETSPAALRAIIKKQARHIGSQGFDHDSGWGVIDAAAIAEALTAPPANYRPPDWLHREPTVDLRPRR
ncbi:MAG TPA: S8 family serine peptidase [Polyangia bacterium]|nr:S8 family serine peptidase [Polyangia bacterium]